MSLNFCFIFFEIKIMHRVYVIFYFLLVVVLFVLGAGFFKLVFFFYSVIAQFGWGLFFFVFHFCIYQLRIFNNARRVRVRTNLVHAITTAIPGQATLGVTLNGNGKLQKLRPKSAMQIAIRVGTK